MATKTIAELDAATEAALTQLLETTTDPGGTPASEKLTLAQIRTLFESLAPGVKGWINFNGTGTIAISDSFNVTSITDNNTGDYTVTWDTDFANTDYCAVASVDNNVGLAKLGAFAVGSTGIKTFNDSFVNADAPLICLMAIGDQ